LQFSFVERIAFIVKGRLKLVFALIDMRTYGLVEAAQDFNALEQIKARYLGKTDRIGVF